MTWPFEPLIPMRYGVIVCDPPWQMKMWSEKGMSRCPDGKLSRNAQRQNNPERHYRTMSLADLGALPVSHLAAPDCVLFLWAIDPMLPQALALGQSWGFVFKTVGFYWAKMRPETSTRHLLHDEPAHKIFPLGTGYWTRANPEQCLLFTLGSPRRKSMSVRKLIVERRREHSRKPEEFYKRVRQLCPGPRADLFSRETHIGFTAWGNDVGKFDQEVA